MTMEEIIAMLGELAAQLQVILDAEAPTQAQLDQADELVKQIEKLEGDKKAIEKRIEIKAANEARLASLKTPVPVIPSPTKTETVNTVHATPARKSRIFDNNEAAYKAGRFFQAALGNSGEAKQWCESNGVDFKALSSNVEGGAGLFVIPEVETAIVRLVEEYGIIRNYADVTSTTSDRKIKWKRASGNTAYFLSETGTPTSTDAQWQTITLTPKILGALTKYSLILDADASVNLADEITRELAYAMAVKEDQCAFVGDGTSQYGGIIGLTYAFQKTLQDGGGTWTNDTHKGYLGSGVVAAGNAFSEVTMQNFIDVKNKIARYPGINPSWFIHDATAAATMERLMYALGGNAAVDATNGVPQRFLGYPVVYVNAMPSTEANSQVFALFGDLSQSTLFCDRQGIEVATNTQSETNFLTRSAQVLGTERFDFIVHDNGNYNATAANRTRGAVAALISTNA